MWERLVLATAMLAGCQQAFGLDPPRTGTLADASAPDAPASCTDQQLSPGETDVDCGGVCPPCAAGDHCADHADCVTSVCVSTTCVLARSCLEIRDAGQLVSGIYPLAGDPAGSFDAFCDQTAAGGGWTLVMKLSSTSTVLAYDSPLWTTTATLSESSLAPNAAPQGSDAKLVAFNVVGGTTLRLQWLDPVHEFIYTARSPGSALQIFSGTEHQVEGDESNACHGSLLDASPSFLPSHMRHAAGPQFYGINGEDSAPMQDDVAIRFGFASNDEDYNTWNPHQGAGTEAVSLVWDSQDDCNNCSCYGNAYAPAETSANLWIR